MKILKVTVAKNLHITRPKLLTKGLNKKMDVVEKPIVANMKTWYRDAGEKLNDIYLDQIKNNNSTYISKYNKDAYAKLPDAIKELLKPSDVSYNGHIDQNKIDELWRAAKAAHKPGVYGSAPTFRGELDNSQGAILNDIPSLEITHDNLDLAFEVREVGALLPDEMDNVSDLAQDFSEHGTNFVENLADLLG